MLSIHTRSFANAHAKIQIIKHDTFFLVLNINCLRLNRQ